MFIERSERRKEKGMETEKETLADANAGKSYTITGLNSIGAKRRRLMDLGFAEGACVSCLGKSPFGDPKAYLVRGAVIALRKKDARDVFVRLVGTV